MIRKGILASNKIKQIYFTAFFTFFLAGAGVFSLTETTVLSFFRGRLTPYEPITILPRLVFLSPFPITINFNEKNQLLATKVIEVRKTVKFTISKPEVILLK